MVVKYKLERPDSAFALYAKPGDSCIDLVASEQVVLSPLQTKVVWTDLSIQLPEGYEAQVRPRSSLSSQGMLVHFGTIDNGYRGRIGVTCTNLSDLCDVEIEPGDRVAQLAVVPIQQHCFLLVDELERSVRGDSGYGSTGRSINRPTGNGG